MKGIECAFQGIISRDPQRRTSERTGRDWLRFGAQVGEGVAAEMAGHKRIYKSLVDFDEVIKSPSTCRIPDDPAASYAMASMLAYRATADNLDAVLTYAARFPHREFFALTVKDAVGRNPKLKIDARTVLKKHLNEHGPDLMKDWN